MKDLIDEYDVMQDFTAEMEEAYLFSDIMSYIKVNGYELFKNKLDAKLEEYYYVMDDFTADMEYEQFRKKLNAKLEEYYLEQMASFLRYKEQSE